jgi:hypothetical protein
MNAEVSGMFLEGTMDVVASLAVSHNPAFAQEGGRVQLAIGYQKPLVRVPDFHLLSGE